MPVFKDYAKFYNSLYQDKDYKEECNYIEKLFKKYLLKKPKTILDLGCGTGNHDFILAKKGYMVTGVDLSGEMLKIAKKRRKEMNLKVDFFKGDIRKVNLKKRFDVVISMFAVIGYQISNDDLEKALKTAFNHLKKGGLFVFDVWFGPAVLADKPKDKVKKIKHKNSLLIRKTKIKFNLLKQMVDISFETKKYVNNKVEQSSKEIHPMRFFFYQEIKYFLSKAGLDLVAVLPFLKLRGKVKEKDWNICVIAQRK